ncbi:MAG: beta-lactamase family protein [Gammaproteobacteria bacterium]|jgi:CubicO group peptidase (beta-lactamase class C family)|nr:beta-lactamase family protein [Gammaproteobacteria bacterium]
MNDIKPGSPVPPGQRVPHDDWDRAPWNRWTFQRVREYVPTTEVWRGSGPVRPLERNSQDLGGIEFGEADGQKSTLQQWIDNSYTDGILLLHHGAIVLEQYHNGMDERTLHLSQSMAKSVVGVVAGILIGRGQLDPAEQVTHYLPELTATAWQGATLQQVMDMTTGVRYVEDYEALDSDIAVTDIASGWKRPRPGFPTPPCIWDQILTLTEQVREHGEKFQYRSIETDVLAHCLQRVTGTRLAELVSRELWQPLGCEESADFTVDPAGYALACGGLNATLRDYARFGQLLLQQGRLDANQLVPADWIADIHNADHSLFGKPYTQATPNGGYRNQFWIEDVDRPGFMARGVFGQLIYVDPATDLVMVKLSSWPEFTSVPRLMTALNAIHAIGAFVNR